MDEHCYIYVRRLGARGGLVGQVGGVIGEFVQSNKSQTTRKIYTKITKTSMISICLTLFYLELLVSNSLGSTPPRGK